MKKLTAVFIFGIIALVVLNASVFVVTQTNQALVLQFGKPVRVEQDPGLKFKLPFVQNVEFYDKRLLDFDAESKEVTAADQKRLIVDAFVRYRITDPLRFKQAASGREDIMRSRLNAILESSLKRVIGQVPLSKVVSEQRADIMQSIQELVQAQAKGIAVAGAENVTKGGFGIEVIDVRIKRADLPPANSESIYQRMQTEREREAAEFRARGEEDAQKIRSQADKERTILLADAKRKAEILRGEGDGEATKIFADSFGKDEDFFRFYRSMQAYRKTLNSDDTTMILSPDSDFLKYIENSNR